VKKNNNKIKSRRNMLILLYNYFILCGHVQKLVFTENVVKTKLRIESTSAEWNNVCMS